MLRCWCLLSSSLPHRINATLRVFLVFFGWGGVLGGWVGIITNVALATQLNLHLHFMLRCWCLLSFSLPHKIDYAPLLMSPLIFTSAQNWSCSAADVSSHLHFRMGLMLPSGFFGFFWVEGGTRPWLKEPYASWDATACLSIHVASLIGQRKSRAIFGLSVQRVCQAWWLDVSREKEEWGHQTKRLEQKKKVLRIPDD